MLLVSGEKVRRPFTTAEAKERGYSANAIRWNVRQGNWQRLEYGVFVKGAETPSQLERSLAKLVVTGGVAVRSLAGTIYQLDDVRLGKRDIAVRPGQSNTRRNVCRLNLAPADVWTYCGLDLSIPERTLIDLGDNLGDESWECAMESALRQELLTVGELEVQLLRPIKGVRRARRVMEMRPHNARPTGSYLETKFVQMLRKNTDLPAPERQWEVRRPSGGFVGYLDFCWPDIGLFIECDGQQHDLQAVYDASRETAVVALMGWLPGRFTWHQVVRTPVDTARRVEQLYEKASAISRALKSV